MATAVDNLHIWEIKKMHIDTFLENSKPFLEYVLSWEDGLIDLSMDEVIDDPSACAIVSVDVINGFCYEGYLSSPRVQAIIEPIVSLFKRAREAGVENIILSQDSHDSDALEFGAFPPHCVRGSDEADSVPEFKTLEFYDEFIVMPKTSISSTIDTDLVQWLENNQHVETFIIVGDCTDLCTYQLVMGIHLRGIARNIKQRVVVPVNCVATYDMPVDMAQEVGAVPHDGDLLNSIFLYSMMLNGVEVVRSIS